MTTLASTIGFNVINRMYNLKNIHTGERIIKTIVNKQSWYMNFLKFSSEKYRCYLRRKKKFRFQKIINVDLYTFKSIHVISFTSRNEDFCCHCKHKNAKGKIKT